MRNGRKRRFSTAQSCLIISASTFTVTQLSLGNSETYLGPDSGDFSSPGNWNTSIAPNSGDNVFVGANEGINTNFNVNFDYQSSNYTSGGFNSLTIDSPSSTQSITVTEAPSDTIVGSLSTNTLVVGDANEGTFVQGGTSTSSNTISGNIILGRSSNSSGEYDLDAGGSLTAAEAVVGSSGSGTFVQGSGSSAIIDDIAIGQFMNSSGTYQMNGGTLSTDAETLAASPNSSGAFVQGGGTHTITGDLIVAELPSPSSSAYTLQAGNLSAGSTTVGFGGTGMFTQSGGTNTVAGALLIGTRDTLLFIPMIGNGSYILSAGTLMDASMSVGSGGTGTFSQSGGTATVGPVTIQTNLGSGSLSQSGGNLTATSVLNNGTINQTDGTSNLGAVTGTGSIQIGSSTGSPHTTVASIAQASASILQNGLLTISVNSVSANSFGSLTIQSTGMLDLTNNHFIINYGGSPDPVSVIRGYLVTGYNSGAWNGHGINSSSAAANPRYGVGYADSADLNNPAGLSSGQIEVKYTLLGDANLDGLVSGNDFTILVGNLGKSVAAWDKGDFNYDGVVSGNDFTALVGNLGKQSNGANVAIPASVYAAVDAFAAANGLMADVPEPSFLSLAALAGSGVLARRRSK